MDRVIGRHAATADQNQFARARGGGAKDALKGFDVELRRART
jgi:hypothetical protein